MILISFHPAIQRPYGNYTGRALTQLVRAATHRALLLQLGPDCESNWECLRPHCEKYAAYLWWKCFETLMCRQYCEASNGDNGSSRRMSKVINWERGENKKESRINLLSIEMMPLGHGPTQRFGTAMRLNKCGDAIVDEGYCSSELLKSGWLNAARKCATDSHTA